MVRCVVCVVVALVVLNRHVIDEAGEDAGRGGRNAVVMHIVAANDEVMRVVRRVAAHVDAPAGRIGFQHTDLAPKFTQVQCTRQASKSATHNGHIRFNMLSQSAEFRRWSGCCRPQAIGKWFYFRHRHSITQRDANR